MPFYLAQDYLHTQKSIILKNQYKKIAPLQVRISCHYKPYKLECHVKRALSCTSRQERASLSVEAALCLSLFLFLSVCLMMPMKMMDRQRQIQAVVESVGEELSQYAYVEYCLRKGDEAAVDTGRAKDGGAGDTVSLLAAGYAAARILGQIDNSWIESVSFQGTDIGTDDMVYIVMNYRMRLPFSVLGLSSIPVQHICNRRMWNGSDGGRFGKNGASGDAEDVLVYIGKNPTRYHLQRTCHYLYNDLTAVSADEVESMRNQSGGRYAPCKSCGAGRGGETVYIMPYGGSYHYSRTCSSIIAYVQSVPLSEVEYLGKCSYCGGK